MIEEIMANFDLEQAEADIKEYYDPNKMMDVCYGKRPFLGMVPKDENVTGNPWKCPIITGRPENTSATASDAFAGLATSEVEAFLLTRGRGYNRCTLDQEAMLASANDKGAFLSTATLQIDGMLASLSTQLGIQLWKEGWGDLGVIDTLPSATSFKLVNVSDIVGFERGQQLVFSDSQHSDVLRSGTAVVVTKVNRNTGVVTVDTALATPGAIAGDWVFKLGDRQNSATPKRLVVTGVRGFIPLADPSASEDFFGVDRSVDPTRLAGQRLDCTGMSPIEAINTMAGQIDREGGTPDYVFMNSQDFATFVNTLSSKQLYEMVQLSPEKNGVTANVGFSAIKLLSNFGELKVVSDPLHPKGTYDFIQMDTWLLGSLGGEAPRIFDRDANMLRLVGQDAYEVRGGHYSMLRCTAPGYNGVCYNLG
jgi:hypothetical protein